jgi:hypothetical protein
MAEIRNTDTDTEMYGDTTGFETSTDTTGLAVPMIDVSTLKTFDEVAQAAREMVAAGAQVLDTADLADGFTLLKDKNQLVGSEFFIVSRKIRYSDSFGGSSYSVIRIVTRATDSRVVITDGSTGIHAQLGDLGENVVVYCKNGLVRSDYPASEDYDPESGTGRPAGTTYYLDTSGGRLPAGTL